MESPELLLIFTAEYDLLLHVHGYIFFLPILKVYLLVIVFLALFDINNVKGF